tara:strand:- start:1222 stop:1464 length:243 start_codon:yes stop_codon:yes gene_type:complete
VAKEFEARLQHYRSIAPKTADEFELVNQRLLPSGIPDRWNCCEENFDDAMGQTILARIAQVQCERWCSELSHYTDGVLTS